MTLSSGTKLGRYEIRSKLGEGGMGEVYLARDTQLDREIAIKILTAEVARDQQPPSACKKRAPRRRCPIKRGAHLRNRRNRWRALHRHGVC